MIKKIGVLAGEPVDTDMGVDYLKAKGMLAYPYPAASTAAAQTQFQMLPESKRNEKISMLMREMRSDGIKDVMVYCNSLSSTVDTGAIAESLGMKAVTPLMAYREIAREYETIGVMAGNCQGLAGIERAILGSNPKCIVLGVSLYKMVLAIENFEPQMDIFKRCGVASVLDFYGTMGAQAIVLGCTHFPYLYDEIKAACPVPLIDPADRMFEMLR